MPEYLAPAVYVEEVSFRSKSIEGVSTSTAAFVGLTRKGPSRITPELLTSFGDFERIYGGLDAIGTQTNYLAHAVRAFFDNGGGRLYVSRVVAGTATAGESDDLVAGDPGRVVFKARFPGAGGNGSVLLFEKATPIAPSLIGSSPLGSILRVTRSTTTGTPPVTTETAEYFLKQTDTQALSDWSDASSTALQEADFATSATEKVAIDLITLNVVVQTDGSELSYEDLGFDARHPRWIGTVLAEQPTRRSEALSNPLAIAITQVNALALRASLDAASQPIAVKNGTDGTGNPTLADFEAALEPLKALEDISIVAAPGYSAYPDPLRSGIQQALIAHVSRRRAYEIAVLDTPPNLTPTEARSIKSAIDSSYAALYYPWVVVANPQARPGDPSVPAELSLPPSGFVCGIYARTDIDRGVFKAPANEIVRGAVRFETDINFAQQEMLNPLGINCLRYFPNRGYRVWGARTTSSDPEWKYVSLRRYFNYLEASIDRSTQWAVFEVNGEHLWSNIQETVSAFLYSEWRTGALLGSKPEEAFFVRCDRTTMTQNDLDNGRLICLIGVAVAKPAEFVVFRIGQKTVDRT